MSKRSGFTLVELLVVIAIIAILSVIGMTVFTGIQKSARDAKRKADVESIMKAYEVRYNSIGNYGDTIVEGTAFASGSIPTPPEGGEYDVILDNDTHGIKACTTLEDSTDFCKGSVQEQPPTDSSNVTYLSGEPAPTPTPSPSPTLTPSSTPTPPATPAPPGPNLLANGSFEPDLTSWGCNLSAACSSDSVSHSGNRSVRLTRTIPGNGWGDAIFQTVPNNLAVGNYCVSAWIRKSAANVPGGMSMQDSLTGNATHRTNTIGYTNVAAAGWTQVRGILIKGSGFVDPSILVLTNSSTTNGQYILIDDVTLQANATATNCPTLP